MIEPPEDRRPPLTPQLALRVAVVGSVALALFAIIFFRLWFLQVLSGDQYVRQANVNRVRDIAVAAPRGEILDSSGVVMVDNIKALAVTLSPPDLPVPVTDVVPTPGHPVVGPSLSHPARRDAKLYNRLADVVRMPTKRRRCVLPVLTRPHGPPVVARLSPVACDVAQQVALVPYGDVTVKRPVSRFVQYYLAERQNDFPGVSVDRAYVTHYPLGTLAAQVLGTVGPINSKEYGTKAYRGISANTIIGQSGLEAEYDGFLLGKDGKDQVQVDSQGQPTGDLHTTPPIPGQNLATSLDVNLQRVGEQALATSIASNPGATGGAFVAMNPTDGEIYAMGSNPTFNPSIFTKSLSQVAYDKLVSTAGGDPLLNRATQSAGPTGSAFKPITATAALESGVWTAGDEYDDTGSFCFPNTTDCLHNAGHAVDGTLDLVNAIRVSSDDFFYNLGYKTNADPVTHPNGGPLDQWARAFGIGGSTRIDLPGAVDGTLPTPRWRADRDALELQCEQAKGQFKGGRKHPAATGGCGIADGNPWTVGDNVNLAVGQGDVQVTPMQLAVVYAALANGGTIVRPHIGLNVETKDGTVLQKIDPSPARHIPINPSYLGTILAGLRAAASQPGGTSDDVFGNFPEQVYGKTGTAQYVSNGVEQDYAWYACFVPATVTTKPIVVVVHVERGGFGDVAAAPVARQILSQWFLNKPGPYKSGSSATL
jgi:penicillin-binding protein 2